MSLSNVLGEVLGTTKVANAHTDEDLLKEANFAFLEKMAADENIDLDSLNEDQLVAAFKVAMEVKAAEEGKPPFPPKKGDEKGDKDKGDEAKDKEAAARAELAEKRAASVKIAEADAMGRIMAHSFLDELNKHASEGGGFPFPPKKGGDDKGDKDKEDKDKGDGKGKEASVRDRLLSAFSSTKQAAATGPSSTPTVDEIASYKAIEMLKAAGIAENYAYAQINAAYMRGLPESVKIASAGSDEAAIEIRALEIAEAAGFKVDWSAA